MDNSKLNRIKERMAAQGMPQMIISDPVSIFYLTGKWIFPGERFHVLYLNTSGGDRFILNRLFPQAEDLGVPITYYDDTEDGCEVLAGYMDNEAPAGIDKNWPARFLLRLQELGGASRYLNGSVIVDKVRQIKDEGEQQAMRESGAMLDRVMGKLIPWVSKGMTERELNAKCLELIREEGFEGPSFDPITAYARGAADPHHITDDSLGSFGDCVILDIGGMHDNYASDMTRTVFIGEVSERQKEIYNIVLEANKRGIAMAKPGNRMSDVDKAARDYITEMGFGEYFTHRTGHSIGLEDHETGDVSMVNDEIIEAGQCFSVEPGIYLYDEGIGVRIEDIVLITEDGCEVLNNYPKEEIIVVPESK
ncbi:MAG: aminopeptidase P family protein [Mogibacterium sp.]|nr:aminopeptidase P family protein [Mogibacterium sp.]MBR2540599.1 aminopeptidase P family protein [Mogibacterium sp.]